jgi:hypothetical protein
MRFSMRGRQVVWRMTSAKQLMGTVSVAPQLAPYLL